MREIAFRGASGVRIVADAFGDANDPTVVLLPTTGQTKEIWRSAAHALGKAGRYAICVDLRGHGQSEIAPDARYDLDAYAADLRAILGQLPSRAAVVAMGVSGLSTILAVGEHATPLVSALVLVGVTAWVDADVNARIRKAAEARKGSFSDAGAVLAAVTALHPFEPAPTAVDKLLTAFEVGPDGRYRWRCDHRVVGAFDLAAESARMEAASARITAPTALIRGSVNESVSAEAVQKLQALIPGAEAFEIDGAGHHVVTDREDEFNAALLDFMERAAPRDPIQYESGSDPRLLRDALGCFGTGVTIITTFDRDGAPIGLTANSFTSVSLEPPLILFCLSKGSANLQTFVEAEGFAINVLHIGQQPTSTRFTQRDGSRFEGTPWEGRPQMRSPILSGSLASFDCVRHAVYDGGDHRIFIGRVVHAQFAPHRDPLLYFRGKYRRLHFA
jgi:flavin reductase (DIM6/NTAB) family NADH-FMN oxidoreductase RutF/pimeloyl-ACP methyl ester carboxylesterase